MYIIFMWVYYNTVIDNNDQYNKLIILATTIN